MPVRIPSGTEGYATEAEALVRQYESITFADVHRRAMHLMPSPPARMIDIGAASGRDAAGFAAPGHSVVAAEPTAALRTHAMRLHPSPDIEWIADSLADLPVVSARAETFDLVMLTAVWMHLDTEQRRRGMPRVAALLRPHGIMLLTLRHGPVPAGRRMFDVTPEETVVLAQQSGLSGIQRWHNVDAVRKRPGITWDRLAFARAWRQSVKWPMRGVMRRPVIARRTATKQRRS